MGTRYGGGRDGRNQRGTAYNANGRQSRPVQRLSFRRENSGDPDANLSSFYRLNIYFTLKNGARNSMR